MDKQQIKYGGLFGYFRSLLDTTTPDSTKSFTLLLSALIGALIGICMCFAICYDVVTNGYIKTNLTDAGMFLLCTGGYMFGAGATKAIVDSKTKQFNKIIGREENEESDE